MTLRSALFLEYFNRWTVIFTVIYYLLIFYYTFNIFKNKQNHYFWYNFVKTVIYYPEIEFIAFL